jgi:hypothetical protein
MAEINSTATESPCGKISLGADPSGVPAVDIRSNTTRPCVPTSGTSAGRFCALAGASIDG